MKLHSRNTNEGAQSGWSDIWMGIRYETSPVNAFVWADGSVLSPTDTAHLLGLVALAEPGATYDDTKVGAGLTR